MEITVALSALSHFSAASPPPRLLPSSSSLVASLPFYCSNTQLQGVSIKRKLHPPTPVSASSNTQTPSTDVSERWLLEPVGDGDTRHIGFKVQMPSAFEIASNVVTVGRLPEKADLVIPVATVSGLHARIRKKDGNLLVTDLDSTNGTFIDDQRLRPGVVATLSPGSCVTFGDEHLAVFRVSKLDNAEATSNPGPSEDKVDTVIPEDVETVATERTKTI
ncbi:PREDICTED: uncharacterized protein LOC101297045 isoform X1 [Fragaria vesca subsp. vesca]|uniref:uncharacterized protein LOC101297045 isoform X1 n=1 Tax=Fragaria vesca subsp. vesca TaxID=101020 RepID=UPI0002C346C0|nr:PREDICTED: uncharacterized protein LOC101297045 isoform X1 [Fragaria vesca subsp. vesca]